MPVGNGATLCTECADADSKSRVRERDWKREYAKRKDTEDPKYRRFYRSKEWTMASQRYAHERGYRCEDCTGCPDAPPSGTCRQIGTDVHHKKPIQTPEGWERRFDFDNLELLCVRKHNERHGRTFGNGWQDGDKGTAQEAVGDADGPLRECGEGGEDGAGRGRKVSDYRL